MARLIVLNGPPGCGKSTLAGLYVRRHPLALCLDIDRIRDLIGCWPDQPEQAGRLARSIAVAAARTHLQSGHDVIVPQLLARPELLDALARLAGEVGAQLSELVLFDSKENALRRFAERSSRAADPAHLQAQEMVDRAGGPAHLADLYDRLMALVATRPATRMVPTVDDQVEAAYQSMVDSLDG